MPFSSKLASSDFFALNTGLDFGLDRKLESKYGEYGSYKLLDSSLASSMFVSSLKIFLYLFLLIIGLEGLELLLLISSTFMMLC